MPLEIERKFLVLGEPWKTGATGTPFVQGYLSNANGKTVRIRIAGERSFLTIKGPTSGFSRLEFEYPIPLEHARELFPLCEGALIEKTRFRLQHAAHLWEIDVFHAANDGLVVAEIELSDPAEPFVRPEWLGPEVSEDLRYSNVQLTRHPFRLWNGG
jgi:adenylate cyclase